MTTGHRVITEEEMEAASARPLTAAEVAAYIAEIEAHPDGIVYIGPEEEWT